MYYVLLMVVYRSHHYDTKRTRENDGRNKIIYFYNDARVLFLLHKNSVLDFI